jgi:glycosyltransferase involved in cell wall biosynthesis
MASISYCISACNEHVELDKLLNQLSTHLQEDDELVLLIDESKVTQDVSLIIQKYRQIFPNFILAGASLNGDFATFKNNFVDKATKEFIFQIDADELLSEDLLVDTKLILDVNPNVDMYLVSRENYVEGLTPEHIQKWRWNVDEKNRINWPDVQFRIFKNNKKIKWRNKVHEILEGYTQYATLPPNYYLIHQKDIVRQEQQNHFYNTL